ncbi:nucleoplasmin-like protein ANO39 [Biomphalaria pfeifferi]|uniref:Nucleoplasmin-like protein ANO39 n=1 Tax=Biomphalaria pfeifferi TaxID=112525 RepID=A0AAD8FC02_BIOPF|nr:nucleoplasmin-like protein ANO39 [Biomphalaria pfeifferi]
MANRSRNFSEKSNNTSRLASGVADVEYFWSAELHSSKKSVTWVIKSQEPEEDDEDFIEHTLFIKMAVLGSDAVKGEQNIITLTSTGGDGEVQKGVIAHLTRGENSSALIDLTISGKIGATLTLSEGSGPVCISGNQLLEYPKEEDYLDMSQDEEGSAESEEEMHEEEEEEEAETKGKKTPKRKASVKSSKTKKAKVDADDDDEDEDDDDDDDDEDDEDYEEDVKSKRGKKGKVETKKAEKSKQEKDKTEITKKSAKKQKK